MVKSGTVIKALTVADLRLAIYKREGWGTRAKGESQNKRIAALYSVTIDNKINRWVATKK
jgi:hypothetical protein